MMSEDLAYPLVLAGLGALALLVAWLPLALKQLPLSLPLACVAIGAAIFSAPHTHLPLDPLAPNAAAEHLSELVVLVSLMGAGLKLDRPMSWRGWTLTWRLIFVTMPVSILLLSLIGWQMLGLGFGCALMLGAALAPTDPVLAGDVQVGPPGQDGRPGEAGRSGGDEVDEVRFALTSEAGLNDAAAFPFVLLALGIVGPHTTWISHWIAFDLVWRTAVGLAVGVGSGRLLGWLAFRLPEPAQLSRTEEGFVSLAATLLTYGLCQIAGGYGFVAVFLAALSFRHMARGHAYHQTLYGFSESIERLLTMIVLLLLGGALANGLLAGLRWPDAVFAALALLVVRPLAGMIGLSGLRRRGTGEAWFWDERLAISFFGIRGIGSIYYLVYALNRHDWPDHQRLQAIIGFVVLLSILIHGISVTPAMRWLDRRRHGRPVADLVTLG